jgi:AraC family transcriptional regulator
MSSMLLHQFPDLNMVRQLRNQSNGIGREWMNVALNVKCREASRTNVEGPFSIFANITGHSYCKLNGKNYRIENDQMLISMPGDVYDLEIDNLQKTETFNIHINQNFFQSCAASYLQSSNELLDAEHKVDVVNDLLYNGLQKVDNLFLTLLKRLQSLDDSDHAGYEIVFSRIVSHVMMQEQSIRTHIQNLPVLKASVREDIYRRLSQARDQIYSNYFTDINLDDLALVACMSKFHFLRMFKAFFGQSPHQFLINVRLEKSLELLKSRNQGVNEIAEMLGFQYANSFIKAFVKCYGSSPLKYTKSQNSNFG